jgi:hypothetical protein
MSHRGVARTAVVAGTASAVSSRVQRRQAERFADRDAAIYANRAAAYRQQVPAEAPAAPPIGVAPAAPQAPAVPTPAAPPAAPPAPAAADVVGQLERLAALLAQGVLTQDEFDAQKAKLLAI